MSHPAWFISRDGVCEARASDGLFLCHCVLLKIVRLTWFVVLSVSLSRSHRRTKKESVEPRPLREPRPKGAQEQHMADAPISGASTKHCLLCSRAKWLRLVVFSEAKLDVHTSIKLSGWPTSGHKSFSPLEIRLAFRHGADAISPV